MQKTSKKASIIIWAMFLSLIMITSFISINTKLYKNLKESIKYNENNINYSQIDFQIKESLDNKDFSDKNIWNKYIIKFSNKKEYNVSFKKDEEKVFKPLNDDYININLNNCPWISYEIIDSLESWIINSEKNIYSWTWWILLKNLGWYCNLDISSNSIIEKQYKSYDIYEIIWRKIVLKQSWEIKLF